MAYARHSSNNRRSRNNNRGGNRNNNNNGGNNRRPQARLNHVYDSNGPEGRVRGTAAQIVDKYTSLASDANASGNKVLQQSFLQHAEHYQRILSDVQKEVAAAAERQAEQKAKNAQSNNRSENTQNKNDQKPQTKTEDKTKTTAKSKDEAKADVKDDKMTDVPGFLAEAKTEQKEAKPRGRKPKAETKKEEVLATEPA